MDKEIMMGLTNELIKQRLTEKCGEAMFHFDESYGMLSFEASKENNLKVLQFLFDDEVLNFRFLTDLCAVNYPDLPGSELAVVYHLHNLQENIRIRLKVFTSIAEPDVFNASKLSAAADGMERDTLDF